MSSSPAAARPSSTRRSRRLGPNATGVQGDVAKLADLDRLYETVKQQKGRIDILFANAGIGEMAPLGSITEAHFDKQFDINVKGVLFTVQKALPLLRDGASIILNASITASKGMEAFSVYSATKAAVRSFARTWTTDLKSRRIRVNALSPGPIHHRGLTNLRLQRGADRAAQEERRPASRCGRGGTPEEIAKRRRRSWPRTTAATSPASSCSSTAASRRI